MISNNLSDTFSDTFSFPILYSSPKERKTIIRHPSPHSLTQNYFSPSNLQNKVVLYLFHFLFLFLSWRPLLFLVFFILSHHKWKSDLQKKLVLLSRPNAVKKRQGRAGHVLWLTKLLDISLCIYCLYQRTEILLQSKVLSSLVPCFWKQSNEYNTQSWRLVSKFFNLKKSSQFLFCRAYINTSSQETKSSKDD